MRKSKPRGKKSERKIQPDEKTETPFLQGYFDLCDDELQVPTLTFAREKVGNAAD
jgi:hypothetical protein